MLLEHDRKIFFYLERVELACDCISSLTSFLLFHNRNYVIIHNLPWPGCSDLRLFGLRVKAATCPSVYLILGKEFTLTFLMLSRKQENCEYRFS